MTLMKHVIPLILFFFAGGIFSASLFAAPLEGGFSMAPRSSASTEEREQAFLDARQRVIDAAKKYEGTPYVYGGMSARGTDCSGFISLSFRDALSVTLPRSASGQYSWVEKISLDRAQPGDLLFFKTDSTRNITHVGLYLGGRRFIHAASSGERTGVIYSAIDESYWAHAFAGAGRAFPEAASAVNFDDHTAIADAGFNSGRPGVPSASSSGGGTGRLLAGAAFAPIWSGFLKDVELVRGFTTQLFIAAETYSFGPRMVFGLELRPEYDGALGVFRLPITFSWGPSEKIRVFAGPVFSFGDASLSTDEGERHYSGGTSWLGTVGITAAPFVINTTNGDFAPYLELAWQSYFSENSNSNPAADFSAGFRFSTGIRWTIRVR
jgi:probable lipoprotein NlpC